MKLISTRDPGARVSFTQAVLANLPGDGGLFAPAELPRWPDVPDLLALGWQERSTEILDRLIGDEIARGEIARIVRVAFDFPVPLVEVGGGDGGDAESGMKGGAGAAGAMGGTGEDAEVERFEAGAAEAVRAARAAAKPEKGAAGKIEPGVAEGPTFALELFHGPSLAFKDFGARFLAEVLARLDPGSRRTILTATSGDTGAAVAAAFQGRPGVGVAILYPLGRVSPLQERQLACLGGNVRAFAVEGSFDDCQRMVKACFADPELTAELGLTSANSINIARLLAQVPYYFEALAQLAGRRPGCRPVVAVPSGNFGNLCAGLYARALGLPVAAFVAATNANRTVPDYLDGGAYQGRPSVATMSNAMDVGDPSNWERIEHLLAPGARGAGAGSGAGSREGSEASSGLGVGTSPGAGYGASFGAGYGPSPAVRSGTPREVLRSALRWGSLDDRETGEVLRSLWARGYPADPHAAVACGVLARTRRPGETGIFLATAHPAKFQTALAGLGLEPTLPPALQALLGRPLRREVVPADPALLKARLRSGSG